jgi:hypothetical protein
VRTEEKGQREVRDAIFYGVGDGKDSGFEGFQAAPVRPSGKYMLVKHETVLNNV